MSRVLCVDFGSTFTKAALVDTADGTLVATAAHPTTLATDVLDGLAAIRRRARPASGSTRCGPAPARAAGCGSRWSATSGRSPPRPGYRVGLSAGARVVHVSAGGLGKDGVRALVADRPDVVLLVGRHRRRQRRGAAAQRPAAGRGPARLRVPVVVAGNVEARDEVVAVLDGAGLTALPTSNVLPRIGVLDPGPARAAIREVFIRHVIGGKHLSASPDFAAMVRAATPDAVLSGVELLADGAGSVPGVGDVVVVDVGGATTDVYSVVTPDPEESALHREVVEVLWRGRTRRGRPRGALERHRRAGRGRRGEAAAAGGGRAAGRRRDAQGGRPGLAAGDRRTTRPTTPGWPSWR